MKEWQKWGFTKVSKWSEDFANQWKDTKKVKDATKDVIDSGVDLAFKEYYSAKHYSKLKQFIRDKK